LQRLGPLRHEIAQIADPVLESLARRIHRAEGDLVLEHEMAHQRSGIERDILQRRGNAGENEHPVCPKNLKEIKRRLRGAGRLQYQIHVADRPGHVLRALRRRRQVIRADAGQEIRLAVRLGMPRHDPSSDADIDKRHGGQKSDRARAQHERLPAGSGQAVPRQWLFGG